MVAVQPPSTALDPAPSDLRGARVLVLFGAIPLHGQERGTIEVFRALRPMGLKPLFITRERWGKLQVEPELDRLAIPYVRAPFGPLLGCNLFGRDIISFLKGLMVTSWIVWRECRRLRPTHLYVMNWLYFVYCAPAIFLSPLPLIYRMGDAVTTSTPLHRLLWRVIVRRCEFIVCVSEFVRQELIKWAGGGNKSAVIYNSPPLRTSAEDDLTTLIRPADAVAIVFVGQLSEGKGIELLVNAVRQLIQQGENVVLWVGGDYKWRNPLARRLIQGIKISSLQQRIQFLGYQENVPGLLRAADIHAFPSVCAEGLGNVILEAKAAGIPTVAFPNGGVPELIRHGEDGLLCAESTTESLVAALRTYIIDGAARRAAGEAAQLSLQNRFGYDQFQRKWIDVFRKTKGSGGLH